MSKWKMFAGAGVMLSLGILIAACGGEKLADVSGDDAVSYVSDTMELLDPAEYSEMLGTWSPQSELQLAPLAVDDPVLAEARKVLVFLNPNIIRRRGDLLRAIEAPLHIARYFGALYKAGDAECLQQVSGIEDCAASILTSGECIIEYATTTTGCSAEIYVAGASHTITLTGDLSVTISPLSENSFKVTAVPENLKVTGDDGRYLIYNGTVTKTITLTPDRTGHTSVLVANGLTIEDSAGAVGTADGVRTVNVIYDQSFEAHNVGTLTYTPPDGGETVVIQVDILRQVTIDGDTRTIHVEDKVTTNGVERTRTLDITIEGMFTEGDMLQELVVNGTASFSGPRGEANITFTDLTIDVTCPHNPVGGTIEISGKRTITITFAENCSCQATLTWDDGTVEEINSCNQRSLRR